MDMNSGSASSPAVDELCQISTHMLSILDGDSTNPFISFPVSSQTSSSPSRAAILKYPALVSVVIGLPVVMKGMFNSQMALAEREVMNGYFCA